MFRLPPIRLWRNCSLALFGLGACAALTGTVLIRGKLAIHFDGAGIPNGFAEKWVLWGLLAMAFFSTRQPAHLPRIVPQPPSAVVTSYIQEAASGTGHVPAFHLAAS